MEQRITLITLGVDDLERSTAFFERLGWRRSVKQAEGVSFFQCGGVALGLFPKESLAKDAGVSAPSEPSGGAGFEAFAVAYNTRSKDEVDSVLAEVEAAGAAIVKPAEEAFWGGYSGYFRDLDGHLWEVAWNPGFPLDESGAVTLPD
ncbi:MAG: VOC family protein [Kiloniellales bacterium]